jgi:four helix bundle protein
MKELMIYSKSPCRACERHFAISLSALHYSVSNNIAEGFERGTTKELLSFLYIARGSAGEVRSMLVLLGRRPWAVSIKNTASKLAAQAEECSRQLRAWAESLQDSEIAGQRHLSARTRARYKEDKEAKERSAKFDAMLLNMLPPNHPLRKDRRADS